MVLAPNGVSAESVSAPLIKATVEPATDHTNVDHYVVQIVGNTDKHCTTRPGELSCTISELLPAHKYKVKAIACLDANGGSNPCGAAKVGEETWTKPTRKQCNMLSLLTSSNSNRAVGTRFHKPGHDGHH